jgi:hypothetical protein
VKSLLLLNILFFSQLLSQDRLSFNIYGGLNLLNSNNDFSNGLKIPADDTLRFQSGFELGYETNLFNRDISIAFSYRKGTISLRNVFYGDEQSHAEYKDALKLYLTNYSIDINLLQSINPQFNASYGFSFDLMKREIKLAHPHIPYRFSNVIYGFGLGANGYFEYHSSISKDFEFISTIKTRAIIHLFYKSFENDVSDFKSYYIFTSISLGIKMIL